MIRSLVKIASLMAPFILVLLAGLIYFSLPEVENLKKHNPKTTSFIEMRKQQAKKAGKKLRIRQRWIRFSSIPKHFKQAVRITEDASFYRHKGIDFDELKESIKKDFESGTLKRGGSTITQQLAKNLYLSSEKSFIRKIKEYLIARRLEEALSKNRIFHLYLNVIEFGRGVFGVQAAARYYFGCNAADLSLEQMIRLAAIIPRPLRTNPKKNSRWLLWKSNWILKKLKKYKYISEPEYQQVLPAFQR